MTPEEKIEAIRQQILSSRSTKQGCIILNIINDIEVVKIPTKEQILASFKE